MCAFHRVYGQDKILKCLLKGCGSRCQAHWFVSRTAKLLGFLTLNSFLCASEWSTTKRTSSQLDTTVGSVGVNMGSITVECFRHLVESRPRQIEAVLRAKGSITQ